MAKIPDFSKFDLQSIVNSVKSIINPEIGTPNVAEGDPIGSKVVLISSLLQKAADAQAQTAKDLTQVNNLLNELYKDVEVFRTVKTETTSESTTSGARATPYSSIVTPKSTASVGEPTEEKVEPVTTKTTTTKTVHGDDHHKDK